MLFQQLFFVLACSEYIISSKPVPEEQETEEELPSIIETDTAEDTVDELIEEEESEELPPAGEGSPTEDYCTEFGNFDEWQFFGDGNWHVDNGILYENRGGYYASVAYMYDFGEPDEFELYVDTGWQGNLNDLAGFVFNLDVASETYWLVRIDDPQGDYQRYSPTGRIEVASCDQTGCTIVAHDDSADLFAPADESFVSWGFRAEGEQLTVIWNGQTVFSQQILGLPSAGLVGLYSNDNDGGVIYDNFCVYTSEE